MQSPSERGADDFGLGQGLYNQASARLNTHSSADGQPSLTVTVLSSV